MKGVSRTASSLNNVVQEIVNQFHAIKPSRVPDAPVKFISSDISTESWLYPPIYDIHGEQVQLHGPIKVVQIARRRRIRFVGVLFFRPYGLELYKYYRAASAWGWQGENQIIHLLTDSDVLRHDPILMPDLDQKAATLAHNAVRDEGCYFVS